MSKAVTAGSSPCQTRLLLANAYNVALQEYSKAVLELAEHRSWPKLDQDALQRGVEEAKQKVERARLEYESHIAEHGC